METGTLLLALLILLVGLALGAVVGALWTRGRHDPAAVADQAIVRDGLDRLHDQMRDLDRHRVSWQSQLHEQVDTLRRETATLSTALRRPQVRGRWGELHLRRSVEIAGLVDRCDFSEQVTVSGIDGVLRPDLVVHLAGGKSLVVDAKVPLDAFLDATSAVDDDEREAHLRRHVHQLRRHVDQLSAKAYWQSMPSSPEFVVLFVPGESFLSAALETDGGLLEYAATRQVVLATPTTLIALLRTVAHAWTQEALADKAREIHALGRELHGRLATMSDHLDRLGRSLRAAVGSYNDAVGSLERRVLVSARRFSDLEVTRDELPSPGMVTTTPRPLSAEELLDAVADERDPLPGLTDPGGHEAPRPRRAAG